MTQDTYIIKLYFVKVFKYLSNFHKIISIYELLYYIIITYSTIITIKRKNLLLIIIFTNDN